MDFLLRGVGQLMVALKVPGICWACHIGNTEKFEAERKQWLETSSRDSILADLTRCILQRPGISPGSGRAVFTSIEAASLESIFAAHADQNNFWDQKSLESYLFTQIPNDDGYRGLLTSCVPSLWKLITHFSQWPFISTAPSGSGLIATTGLTFHAVVRATAFLSGRHSIMFSYYNEEPRDAVVSRRTDRLVLEHIFRALASDTGEETTAAASSSFSSSYSLHDDVLDTLNTVQPLLHPGCTTPLNRGQLDPLAIRLLPPPHTPTPEALSSLVIPSFGTNEIIALLDLFVLLLQHISKFDTTAIPGLLIKDLERARIELHKADCISFDTFIKWLGSNNEFNIYDSIALLFNTLPNPKSLTEGITINRHSKDGETLYVYGLRRPGLKMVLS